jgi:hypothetical protein
MKEQVGNIFYTKKLVSSGLMLTTPNTPNTPKSGNGLYLCTNQHQLHTANEIPLSTNDINAIN